MSFRASQVYSIFRIMTSLTSSTMFTTYAVYYIAVLGLNPFEMQMVGTVL